MRLANDTWGGVMTVNMFPPLPPNVAGRAVDVDGAVTETGPEREADEVDPTADFDNPRRDSDGTPVGLADAEADAAPN
jgi:hypothetical protein